MKLGDKVYIIDEDGCKAVRKGTITAIKTVEAYKDFLSSRPHDKHQYSEYEVCAVKNGVYQFFIKKFVFIGLDEVTLFFGKREREKYDILE